MNKRISNASFSKDKEACATCTRYFEGYRVFVEAKFDVVEKEKMALVMESWDMLGIISTYKGVYIY